MTQEVNGERRASREALLLGATIWILGAVSVAYGLRRWFPPLASVHGEAVDTMMHYLLATVGTLFLAGHLVLGYSLVRSAGAGRTVSRRVSPKAERFWSVALAVVMSLVAEGGVIVLGLPVWNQLYGTAPPEGALAVEVTAEQFGWNVRYPGRDGRFGRTDHRLLSENNPLGLDRRDPAALDDVVLLGVLYLPVDQPVHVRLRSKDVLHSFFLPNLRIKQDAVPGMTISFWFEPSRTGTFEIACAELCGFAHYNMRGVLYVVTPGEFEEWLSSEPPFFS